MIFEGRASFSKRSLSLSLVFFSRGIKQSSREMIVSVFEQSIRKQSQTQLSHFMMAKTYLLRLKRI